jgi:hypothetical protein
MAVDVGGGWTVASALAHVGFWDRWQAARWRQTLAGEGIDPVQDTHALENLANVALDPFLTGIAPTGLAAAAIQAAEEVDGLAASAPDATVDAIEGGATAYLLHRHHHRNEHLDQIELALAAGRTPVPAVDRSYLQRNEASLARLSELAGRLTPDRLARRVGDGSWTVGQVLGHLAFWDRFLAARWRTALASGPGVQPTPVPHELADMLNDCLPPAWGAFAAEAGRAAIDDALAAAQAVDGLIAGLPAEAPVEAMLAERPALLDRSIHRFEHLSAIERALAAESDSKLP